MGDKLSVSLHWGRLNYHSIECKNPYSEAGSFGVFSGMFVCMAVITHSLKSFILHLLLLPTKLLNDEVASGANT